MKKLAILAALAIAVTGCSASIAPQSKVDLNLGSDTSALEGLSRSAAGTLWVLSESNIHELDDTGARLRTVELGYLQPEGDFYRDLLDLGDGTFAASHTLAVARLDLDEGTSEDYFCLEPGSFEPAPVEPTDPEPVEPDPQGTFQRRNPTLSADFDDGLIYATPRVLQNGGLVENSLVIYAIDGGVFQREIDLAQLRPEALAVDGDRAFLLEGNVLTELDIGGRDLDIVRELVLEGVDTARGATFDDGTLTVLDERGILLTFAL